MRSVLMLLVLLCAGWGEARAAAEAEPPKNGKSVVVRLRVIDKVAARSENIRVNVGTTAHYRTLSLLPRRCSVNDEGQYAALLEVYDQPPAGGTRMLFSGWMFSASPSLSHLEHPFYDVSLMKCDVDSASRPRHSAASSR